VKRVAGALLLLSCADDARVTDADSHASATRAAIIGGRDSGDEDNAVVYIETKVSADETLRCSGRIVAPGLVMTARHCLLKRRNINIECNPDGTPAHEGSGTEMNLEELDHISVFIGARKPGLRSVPIRELMVDLESTICRGDLAFIVLSEAGLDARTPLRRAPVRAGENISVTGWGYTNDSRDALPPSRATLDSIPIKEVGPGLIPAGQFATDGNTTCLGDSGAVALIDGAAVGVYSTISSPDECTKTTSKNLFQGSAGQPDLVSRAFAAIGETPWYIDVPDVGPDASVADAGIVESDGGAAPVPASVSPSNEGCSTTRGGGGSWLVMLLAVALCRRRANARRAAHSLE